MKNLHLGLLIERTRAYGRRVCEGIASYASACTDVTLDMLNWDEFRNLRKENGFDAFIVRVLDESVRLLKDTSLTVSEIARQSGFPSSQYFCRTFRSLKGCTPQSLRAK